MNARRVVGIAIAVGTATAGAAQGAPIQIINHTLSIDSVASTLFFEIEFDRIPDLVTTDTAGRPMDEIQYWFDADFNWSTGQSFDVPFGDQRFVGAGGADAIIRSFAVASGHGMQMRDGRAEDNGADPLSGGWGPLLDEVAYSIVGTSLTFTKPAKE